MFTAECMLLAGTALPNLKLRPKKYYYYYFHLFAGYVQLRIPETNHVSRVYSVADVLYLQFVLHVMLLRP
jgi:hypothetical protein